MINVARQKSTKPAHTPGPWTVQPCTHGGLLLKRGEQCGPGSHIQSSLQILPTEDAHLMAAAPDLLSALRELHRIVLNGMEDDHDLIVDALVQSTKAMKKAQGR